MAIANRTASNAGHGRLKALPLPLPLLPLLLIVAQSPIPSPPAQFHIPREVYFSRSSTMQSMRERTAV
jgi:hypothetical protein